MATQYTRSDQLNLFLREGFGGIEYSDGDTSEQRLYESVCAATDRSTLSRELPQFIVDWPSEYHLSRQRHCLVRPLGIKPGDTVLELGCGCGAITRFLGELGAEVIAVEGSLQRGRIAAERCRGLPNVRVVVDNLLDFETPECFQWILLIGVLEYSSLFSDQEDPAAHYLRSAMRFLAPNGKLVVAIENKLGLKYFNGLAEDHSGTPFLGVQGLYGKKTARTFGRRELELQIKGAGLEHVEFYYPFPDYKLPRVILSERAFSDELFNPAELLAMCVPRDYARTALRCFDDALVTREVNENGLLPHLSNSFLVVAAQHPISLDYSELAVTFAAHRAREFATQTRFVRSPEGIQVLKEPLDAAASREATLNDGSTLRNLLKPAKYIRGELLYWRLLVARAKLGGVPEIVAALKPWFEYLLRQVVSSGTALQARTGSLNISGRFLDLTPFNLIEGDRSIAAIDQEWCVDRDIPLSWVVTRSVLHVLLCQKGFESPAVKVKDIIQTLYSDLGLAISELEIEDGLNREVELCTLVLGSEQEKKSRDVTSQAWLPLHQAADALETQVGSLHQIIAEQNSQIVSLKVAVSQRDAQITLLNEAVADRDGQTISAPKPRIEPPWAIGPGGVIGATER